MQPNISFLVSLYLDSVLFNLFEKCSTGCQIFPFYCSNTALTAVLDASDMAFIGNSGSYTLITIADFKANFNAPKSVCHAAPNLNNFLPCKISVRGAANLANP